MKLPVTMKNLSQYALTLALLQSCQAEPPPAIVGTTSTLTEGEKVQWWAEIETESGVVEAENTDSLQATLTSDPLKGCGYTATTKDTILNSAAYDSTSAKMSGIEGTTNWTVNGKSTLTMTGGMTSMKMNTVLAILNGSPDAATQKAETYATAYSNNSVFTSITEELTKTVLARTLTCGVMFSQISRMENIKSPTQNNANVTFDKPVPYFISPTLTKERINFELKTKIEVTEITATIKSIENGERFTQTKKGNASIALIANIAEVTDSAGNKINIASDYAYRVISKFEGGTTSTIPWLDQVTDYYIQAGKIVAIVTKIPRKELSILVYLEKK